MKIMVFSFGGGTNDTTLMDFGSGVFTGDARYLEIGVRPGTSIGDYTTLFPRQALTPAPYALALSGLWTQQNATSPNLIGGYSGNGVTAGVEGATIGGGGNSDSPNRVTDSYGTVGGGVANTASGDSSTLGGGRGRVIWISQVGSREKLPSSSWRKMVSLPR